MIKIFEKLLSQKNGETRKFTEKLVGKQNFENFEDGCRPEILDVDENGDSIPEIYSFNFALGTAFMIKNNFSC